jgi:uncharacterized protein with HEPN domain
MKHRAPLALHHMAEAIEKLDLLLSRYSAGEIRSDFIRSAALERLVEIISEASRRVEPAWKAEYPDIPWKDIAGIGSILRHDYDAVHIDILMRLNGLALTDLGRAVEGLLQRYDPEGLSMKRRLFPRPSETP